MDLVKAVYEVNGHEIELVRASMDGEPTVVVKVSKGRIDVHKGVYKQSPCYDEMAWFDANKIMTFAVGPSRRTKFKGVKVANARSSEINHLASLMRQVAGL